ncbi:MAG: AAA family ATPase [Gammaproteobacteria bacterium]
MDCPSCHAKNEIDDRFCGSCGAELLRQCHACNATLKPGKKFCTQCGVSLGEEDFLSHDRARHRRSLTEYTPKHLADKILKYRFALEGELKQVSVLFADVKNSMELAEELDPEAWHKVLDQFFDILGEGIHRFEGSVNQYTGDGVMALFGAPIAHEDHAQRACRAALYLNEKLKRFSIEIEEKYPVRFATRMGINSGEVVVGAIGDNLRMDYTAQGHIVGLAQRMESMAAPNTCYLTHATAKLVDDYFSLEDLGETSIEGIGEPQRIYRLLCTQDASSRLATTNNRGLSNFVGREKEQRALEDVLAETERGRSQIVAIVAEAGVGKSRLCFEFLKSCRGINLSVFEARAVAHGRDVPYLPVLELFRSLLGITSEDDDLAIEKKIISSLPQNFMQTIPTICNFLGVAQSKLIDLDTDPDERQRQLIGVMSELIRSKSAENPIIILVEDLHWLDAASEVFLEQLLNASEANSCLFVLNFRPEFEGEWLHRSWYHQIPLMSLGRDSSTRLITDLLGKDPSICPLRELIFERTKGNPFFTEEIMQSLIESSHLEGTTGAYRLVTPTGQLAIPPTVQAVLSARIDRLEEREKHLLQLAALIGKEFSANLLTAVSELSGDAIDEALRVLASGDFVYQKSVYPRAEYAFKHPLTQEVARGSQLREKRRLTHAAIANAIEQQGAGHLEEYAALLAHHWEEAGELRNAASWHARAAEWAGRTNFSAAKHHWQHVLTLVRDLSGDHMAAKLGVAACTQLLSLSLRMGAAIEEAHTLLQEGQALATSINDKRAYLDLAQAYGFALNSNGDMSGYLELSLRNQRTALEIDDVIVQANASLFLVDALGHNGRLMESLRLSDESIARYPHDIPREQWTAGLNPQAMFSLWRGYCLAWTGRLIDGFKELDRTCDIAQQDRTLEVMGYALNFIGELYYHLHDVPHAHLIAKQSAEISTSLGEPANMVAMAQLTFGYAELISGRPGNAIAPARAALKLHGRVENEATGWSANLLADALLENGDLDSAVDAADQAITLCCRSKRELYEAMGHITMATALIRRDGAKAQKSIKEEFDRVVELVESTGAVLLLPSLNKRRADLAAVLGDGRTQSQYLEQAKQEYSKLGANYQAQRLDAEIDMLS